jgi:ribosomal protein L7/L12
MATDMNFEKLLRLRDNLLNAAVEMSEKLVLDAREERACDLATALDTTFRVLQPVALLVEETRPPSPYTVVLTEVPQQSKIQVIKALRDLLGLPLKMAKDMTEQFRPVIKRCVSRDAALAIQRRIITAGGVAVVMEGEEIK